MNEDLYELLKFSARDLLIRAGKMALTEKTIRGKNASEVSVKEMLEIATRALKDCAKEAQLLADVEELLK